MARIATAPFNMDIQNPHPVERTLTHQGNALGARVDSLTLHLVRRVEAEKQWAVGTTAGEYVGHLHQAAQEDSGHIALFRQWGIRDIVAIIVPTHRVLEMRQRGPKWEPNLVVLYRADRGMLISGYQFSTMDAIHIPDDALWLR